MPRKLRRQPVGNGESGPRGAETRRVRAGQADDRDLTEVLDRFHVAPFHRRRLVRPWRQDHRLNSQRHCPRRLDREQAVADRSEAGPRGDHDRERELTGEVAYEVVLRQRDEQAPDAFDYESVGFGGLCLYLCHQFIWIDFLTGQLLRQVRADGGAEAVRRDVFGRLADVADGCEQLVIAWPVDDGLIQAGYHRLEGRDREAAGRCRRADRSGEHGFADARVGTGYEDATHAPRQATPHAVDIALGVAGPVSIRR